jgi:hypothetical protein
LLPIPDNPSKWKRTALDGAAEQRGKDASS